MPERPAPKTPTLWRVVLSRSAVTCDGPEDAVSATLRRNAEGSPAVLIRLIEGLTAIARAGADAARRAMLRRQADLAETAAERNGVQPAATADLQGRRRAFDAACEDVGPAAAA